MRFGQDDYAREFRTEVAYQRPPTQIGTVPISTLFSVMASPKQFVDDIAVQFENLANMPASHLTEEAKKNLYGYRGRADRHSERIQCALKGRHHGLSRSFGALCVGY